MPPGENGLVAFEDGAGVNGGDIWTVQPDGSQPLNLTNTPSPVDELYPTFSANGRRIFFVREAPSTPDEVWSMALDGSDQVRVLAGTPSEDIYGLAVSPDGTRLAFSRAAPQQSDIWVAGIDGSAPVNLTNTPPVGEDVSSFSPDGLWIAFSRCAGPVDPCDLGMIRSDGSAPTNLTNSAPAHEREPSFSPDGTRLAFNRFDTAVNIWAMNLDGSAQVNLTTTAGETEQDAFPVYSGDGTQIYFERCSGPVCDLWSIPSAGGAATNLTPAFDANVSEPDAQTVQRCGKRRATIVGDDSANRITGTNGKDVIVSNAGKDRVNGRGGKDVICGDAGKDKLRGGKGKDKLNGGKGKDRLIGGGGKDSCIGGKGKDRASACEKEKGI